MSNRNQVIATQWFVYGNAGGGSIGVVAIEEDDGSWRALIGAAEGNGEELDGASIAEMGAMLDEHEARGFFPQFSKRAYFGNPRENMYVALYDLASHIADYEIERFLVLIQGTKAEQVTGERYMWMKDPQERQEPQLSSLRLLWMHAKADPAWREIMERALQELDPTNGPRVP